MRCPNKNTNEWRELVKAVGSETEAYRHYMANKGDIPSVKSLDPYTVKLSQFRNQKEAHTKAYHLTGNPILSNERIATILKYSKENSKYNLIKFDAEHTKEGVRVTYAPNFVKGVAKKSENSLEIPFKRDLAYYKGDRALMEQEKKEYQVKKDTTSKPSQHVSDMLETFVTQNGGKINSFQTLVDRFGNSIVAAYHTLTKVIDVAKDKEDRSTLPHEVGHFIYDFLGEDHTLIKMLNDEIGKTDFKATMRQIDARYSELYANDSTRLKKELAGQLIGLAIEKQAYREGKGDTKINLVTRNRNLLQRIWDRFLTMFSKASDNSLEAIKQRIEEITGKAVNVAFSGKQLPALNTTITPVDEIFYQTKSERSNPNKQKQEYEKELAFFTARIHRLETYRDKILTQRKQYDPDSKAFQSLTPLIDNATKEINSITQQKESFLKSRNPEILRLFAEDILKNIGEYIQKLKEGKEINGKDLVYASQVINIFEEGDIAGVRDIANNLYKDIDPFQKKYVIDEVNRFTTENFKITEKEINDQFEDIGRIRGWTGALSDLPNYISRTIAAKTKAAQNRISVADKESTAKIEEAVKKFEDHQNSKGLKGLNIYDIMIQEINGTNELTREFTTEYYAKLKEAFQKVKGDDAGLRAEGRRWLNENTKEGKPVDNKYFNKNYQTIFAKGNEQLAEFHKFHTEMTEKYAKKLPVKLGVNFIANIQKTLFEQIADSNDKTKTIMSGAKNALLNLIRVQEVNLTDKIGDEHLFQDIVDGRKLTRKLAPEVKSRDLGSNLLQFVSFANSYEEMSEILPELRVLQEQLGKQRFLRSSDASKSILGTETNIYKMVESYIDTQVKGQKHALEGSIDLPMSIDENGNEVKRTIHMSNIVDLGLKYTSLLRIGLNPFSAVNNVIIGEIGNITEAIGGRYFTMSGLNEATKIFATQNLVEESKLNRMHFTLNILQEMEDYENFEKVRVGNKLTGEKFFNMMYNPQKWGEKYLQTRTAIAVMKKAKLTNAKGEQVSVWDLFEEDPKSKGLTLSPEIKKANFATEEEYNQWLERLQDKIYRVNQMIHGRYSQRDASMAQQYVIGRMVMQFRKWIPAAWEARVGARQWDNRLQAEIEGRYRTFGRVVWQTFQPGKAGFMSMCSDMMRTMKDLSKGKHFSEMEIYNMRKNMVEWTILLATVLSYSALMSGDHKKDPYVKFALEQLNRAAGDLQYFYSPSAQLQVIESPVPMAKTMDAILRTAMYLPYAFYDKEDNKNAYYISGPRKGENKFFSNLASDLPLTKPTADFLRLWNNQDYRNYNAGASK